jgi:hypothetical protein
MEPGADTLPRAGLMMQLSQRLLCYRRLMNRVMRGPLLDDSNRIGSNYFLCSRSCGAFAFGNDNLPSLLSHGVGSLHRMYQDLGPLSAGAQHLRSIM